MGKLWTDSEVQFLKAAYSNPKGFDRCDIAKKLNRTEAAVACKADDLKLTSRRGKFVRTEMGRKNTSVAQKIRCTREGESERRSKQAIKNIQTNGHPRGHLGKTHTKEVRRKISEANKKQWADPNSKFNTPEFRQNLSDISTYGQANRKTSNAYSRTLKGFRDDIGIFTRSAWEANYARYLNFLIENKNSTIVRWEYEPETFWFEKIRRGCRSYKPDFKVYLSDGGIEYHEVKGWMNPRSKTALNRMRIYHSDIKIVLVDQFAYKAIAREMQFIVPNWEGASKTTRRNTSSSKSDRKKWVEWMKKKRLLK